MAKLGTALGVASGRLAFPYVSRAQAREVVLDYSRSPP